MRKGNEKVFVYGTLKPGFHFGNLYLTQWEHSGPEIINGDLHMVNGGTYAGLNLNSTRVLSGYVFYIDQRMLKVLDKVEGCPDFYRRTKTKLLRTGEDVWVYEYVHREEFNEDNYIKHGTFEYAIGLYAQIPLLDLQKYKSFDGPTGVMTEIIPEYIKVMLGGIPLMIQNPINLGYMTNPLNTVHPCPTYHVKYNDKEFNCKILNGYEFYNHQTEGFDILTNEGIITGIPVDEIELYNVE